MLWYSVYMSHLSHGRGIFHEEVPVVDELFCQLMVNAVEDSITKVCHVALATSDTSKVITRQNNTKYTIYNRQSRNLLRGSEVQPWTTRMVLCQKRFTSQSSASDQLHQDAIQPKPSLPKGEWILTLSLWNQFQRARSSKMVLTKTREWCGFKWFKWFKSHWKSLVSNCQHLEIEISYPRNGQNRPKDTSIRRKVCSNAQTIHDLQLLRCKHPSESQIMSTNLRKHLSKKSTNKEAASSNNTSCTSWVSALHSETAKHNPWHVPWRDHPVAIPRTSCRHDLSNSHGYPEYQRRCDCNDPWTMVNWIRSLNPRCVAPKCLILPNGWQGEKGSYCKIIAQKAFQWVRH